MNSDLVKITQQRTQKCDIKKSLLNTIDDKEMEGEPLKLLTLLKTQRRTQMPSHRTRSKYIVIPTKVVEGKQLGVNLINILRENFTPISFLPKSHKAKL